MNGTKPFWINFNNNGIYDKGSIFAFKAKGLIKNINYKLNVAMPTSFKFENIYLYNSYLMYRRNKLFLRIGRKNLYYKNLFLSTGSLIESNNSQGVPHISFGNLEFEKIQLLNEQYFYKAQISHGWIDKSQYLEAPYLHDKSLHLRKNIRDFYFTFGIRHKVIWGGKTRSHGKQPSSFDDFIRVFFARPGSNNSIYQEQENSLGNHLGVWDFSFDKKIKNTLYSFYYEHPFEDESSARWLLNEFDGKYGFNVSNLGSGFISDFLYEFIYTMDQSGPQGASDSTYGWDNYFNHYIYQSGWTYNNRMIGNPLFTVGKNPGRYNDGIYIINNRIKAHHFGLAGKIRYNANYRILFTYSKNYGTYPDKNYYNSNRENYKFEDGLEQLSALYEIKLKNLWENISITAAYVNDRGDLLPKTDSFMIIINYKL